MTHAHPDLVLSAGIGDHADYLIANVWGGIEVLKADFLHQTFSRHTHEGYTIGVIDRGAQRFFRTGANHIADENKIILVNTDQVHNGQSATDTGWSYRAMYPTPEQLAAVCQEVFGRQVTPYFSDAVVHDPELAGQLRLLLNSFYQPQYVLLQETLLFAVLVRLMVRYARQSYEFKTQTVAPTALLRVKAFLDEHPRAIVSLSDLSLLAQLSPYHLARQFKTQFGLPPHAYQVQARLRLAKQLFKQGFTPAEVALESGFHDQSHLTHHFKKALGITPGVYARQYKNRAP